MSQSTSALRFRQREELLDFLLEISAATSETLTDLDGLLANVAEIIRKVIPYELFAILLHSERQKELRIRYAIGHREEVIKRLVVHPGEGITGVAAATRQPVLVGDVRQDPRYLSVVDAVRSELAAPMVTRNRLVGVIDMQSTHLDAYGEYDRALLRLIAARVATMIDNARLFRRVERQNRTLKILTHVSQEFSSILDLNELLRHIADAVKVLIRYDAFSILLVDRERQCLRHEFSVRYDQRVDLDNIPLGRGITGAAVDSREVVRSDNTLADPRYIPSHEGVRSEVAVPLVAHDRVVGVMDLESDHFAWFTDDHVRMLTLLAPQVASSVENARLYHELAQREKRIEEDLKSARELQTALLPAEAPEIDGLEIAIGYRPARIVGGDLYDFFEYGNAAALVAFGDVSGKGVAAALYGALAAGLLRTVAPRRLPPAALLRTLNQALLERKVDARYVALLVLLWEARGRRLTMANAGALPPIICRGGAILRPRVEGIPLGLLPERDCEETVFEARAGDLVVLYSDGITDQPNPAGGEYGRGGLIQLLRTVCSEPPGSVIQALFADLDRFTEFAPAFDDQTLVVLRVK
ncbi:MAG: SpoIIE family protein phosphatase [Bryobacteraceae bacterium]|jgi:sigma-B regulation protein RsbU (phosphoserine phosphatase)